MTVCVGLGWFGVGWVTSIERTAYPRFKRLLSARELHVFYTPGPEEIGWAREATDSDEHLLALVVWSRCFQRLGHFPPLGQVPASVIDHVRRDLGLGAGTMAVHASTRTAKRHRDLVRTRCGVVRDPVGARKIAAEAIREAAWRKNNPPDLINVALERLVEAGLELPAFSTLDRMASRIRLEVNTEIFAMIMERVGPGGVRMLLGLLRVGPDGRSDFGRLKRNAPRPSWTNFRLQLDHLRWVDGLGDASGWVAGIAASKLADFTGEAEAADAGVMADYGPDKQVALLAVLVHAAQTKARDDVAEMFCRRVATLTKRARKELEELKAAHRVVTERLVANYRMVLERIDPTGPAAAKDAAARQAAAAIAQPAPDRSADRAGAGSAVLDQVGVDRAALRAAREVVAAAGGFVGQYADIDRVSAHHGDNHAPLVARHFRKDRAAMLAMVGALTLEATSADASVLAALDFVREHAGQTRDLVGDQVVVLDPQTDLPTRDDAGELVRVGLDVTFASEDWRRAIRDRAHPGMFVRRHLETCVLTYLAEQLRTGDMAVAGAQAYANWADQLLSPQECAAALPAFCAEVGLPGDGAEFRAQLQARLGEQAAATDAGYPDNPDLVIDEHGTPTLKRYRAAPLTASAQALEAEINARMPERTLLGILARTGHWLGWWRRFGPASGSDPKLEDPFARYVLTTFCYGSNLGPAQTARHIAGITAHELGATARRHTTIGKLNTAIADVVDGFCELDLVRAWGDGGSVAADGTQIDTFIDNLMAETSIRYGGTGGIAYHYISDTYIALFSRFIPCGVWEAVYLIDGLLAQQSKLAPDTVHADTQGQSLAVFALAHLFGFDLMPRIRNWKDLNFYRPSATARYRHIDALFGDPARNVIDWDLIETHYEDLMRVALSIQAGKISSVTLLRRLSTYSRRNSFYRAFREVGRVIRTIALLRYLADAQLRVRTTAATNKAESYNNFVDWCRFGNGGVIADNDPDEQEKIVKFATLLANCVIFHTVLDMMNIIRDLAAEGWSITAADLAILSPYLTERIQRFGVYATDEIALTPDAYISHLGIDLDLPAAG